MELQRDRCPACGAAVRRTARYCGQCAFALETRTQSDVPPVRWNSGASVDSFLPGTLLGGRYLLGKILGVGGFGETYLAYDQKFTERACVVKRQRINANWSDDKRRHLTDIFSREANLLAGLNRPGHPNIPEIFDFLPEQRCLVMKYIVGHDIKAILAERAAPFDVDVALRYIRDICSALAYMHERTPPVLHRDIKPANMLLDSTDRIWLIDFGLAVPESAITGGTPGYAPPEQWAGAAEPRSDVFALGVTLYQLLAGIAAFHADTASAISRGQTTVLPPIRQLNPAVDTGIEALIARCLAADPQDRPDAATLLQALDRLVSRPVIPEAFQPDALPDTPHFVGRERELQQLEQRLHRNHLVALTGLAGLGKTALAAQLAWRMGSREHLFWHRLIPGAGAERLLHTLAAFLAYHDDAILLRLLTRTMADIALPASFSSADFSPERLAFDRCCDYAMAALRGHNYILTIDDAHVDEHDQQLAGLCHRLCELARAGEINLIITARTTPAWLTEHECTALAGLSADAAATLMRAHGLSLSQQQHDQVMELTAGNAEMLHLVGRRLHNDHETGATIASLARSSDLQNYLVTQVYEQLGPQQQQTMNLVAVLGDEGATRDVIEHLSGIADCSALLRELTRHCLIESTASSTGRVYATRYAGLAAIFVSLLDQRRVREIHQRAALYFATEHGQPLRAARHFLAADLQVEAARQAISRLPAIVNAGQGLALAELLERINPSRLDLELWSELCTARSELAALQGRYGVARRWIEQAIAAENEHGSLSAGAAVLSARRRRLLAFYCQRLGDYQGAEHICRTALADAQRLPTRDSERARLHIGFASALWRQGRLSEALHACSSGHQSVPLGPEGDHERLLLWYVEAAVAIDQGRFDDALRELDYALDLATSIGDKTLQARMYEKYGLASYRKGNIDAAHRAYEQSLTLRRAIGDVSGEIAALNDLATVDWAGGRWDEARRSFEAAIHRCNQLGLRAHAATARLNLGQMLLEQHQSATAATQLEQALSAYRKVGDELGIAHCSYLLGDIALEQGDPDRAYRLGAAALEAAPVASSPAYASCALRVMGAACLKRGQLIDADRYLEQAWQAQHDVGDAYDQAWILADWAEVALALTTPELALSRANAGLNLAEEQHILPLIERLRRLIAACELQRQVSTSI